MNGTTLTRDDVVEHVLRDRIVAEARTWLRTPHHHAARVKGAGVDCGLLLAEVYHAAGLTPDVVPEPYVHDWHLHRAEEKYLGIVERFAHRITTPALPGDILLFRFGRCISHGAIVVTYPQIIHAHLGQGVVLDDVETNVELRDRLVGVWSLWPRAIDG